MIHPELFPIKPEGGEFTAKPCEIPFPDAPGDGQQPELGAAPAESNLHDAKGGGGYQGAKFFTRGNRMEGDPTLEIARRNGTALAIKGGYDHPGIAAPGCGASPVSGIPYNCLGGGRSNQPMTIGNSARYDPIEFGRERKFIREFARHGSPESERVPRGGH